MIMSLITLFSLVGCAFYFNRVAGQFRRRRVESRMTRAVRLAFLD